MFLRRTTVDERIIPHVDVLLNALQPKINSERIFKAHLTIFRPKKEFLMRVKFSSGTKPLENGKPNHLKTPRWADARKNPHESVR